MKQSIGQQTINITILECKSYLSNSSTNPYTTINITILECK